MKTRGGVMKNSKDEPHATKDRCNAKTRNGNKCKAFPMKNGRCRMHGGKSTGPKTKEGLARSRRANFKHGKYSIESKELNRKLRELLKMMDTK